MPLCNISSQCIELELRSVLQQLLLHLTYLLLSFRTFQVTVQRLTASPDPAGLRLSAGMCFYHEVFAVSYFYTSSRAEITVSITNQWKVCHQLTSLHANKGSIFSSRHLPYLRSRNALNNVPSSPSLASFSRVLPLCDSCPRLKHEDWVTRTRLLTRRGTDVMEIKSFHALEM